MRNLSIIEEQRRTVQSAGFMPFIEAINGELIEIR
jgi:hypothetical protein